MNNRNDYKGETVDENGVNILVVLLCKTCKTPLTLNNKVKDRGKKDGFKTKICKQCHKKSCKKYRRYQNDNFDLWLNRKYATIKGKIKKRGNKVEVCSKEEFKQWAEDVELCLALTKARSVKLSLFIFRIDSLKDFIPINLTFGSRSAFIKNKSK